MKLKASNTGDFGNNKRFVLTRLLWHMLQIHTPFDPISKETKVLLSISKGSGRPTSIDLTRLTVKELIAFRETVLIATEAAEPICARLDQRAQEAMQNGDDSDGRSYRQVPVFFIRPRALGQHGEQLLGGHADVLQGINFSVMQPNGVSGPGSTMDEPEQEQEASTKDHP